MSMLVPRYDILFRSLMQRLLVVTGFSGCVLIDVIEAIYEAVCCEIKTEYSSRLE
jgi:hypothetical protein